MQEGGGQGGGGGGRGEEGKGTERKTSGPAHLVVARSGGGGGRGNNGVIGSHSQPRSPAGGRTATQLSGSGARGDGGQAAGGRAAARGGTAASEPNPETPIRGATTTPTTPASRGRSQTLALHSGCRQLPERVSPADASHPQAHTAQGIFSFFPGESASVFIYCKARFECKLLVAQMKVQDFHVRHPREGWQIRLGRFLGARIGRDLGC